MLQPETASLQRLPMKTGYWLLLILCINKHFEFLGCKERALHQSQQNTPNSSFCMCLCHFFSIFHSFISTSPQSGFQDQIVQHTATLLLIMILCLGNIRATDGAVHALGSRGAGQRNHDGPHLNTRTTTCRLVSPFMVAVVTTGLPERPVKASISQVMGFACDSPR